MSKYVLPFTVKKLERCQIKKCKILFILQLAKFYKVLNRCWNKRGCALYNPKYGIYFVNFLFIQFQKFKPQDNVKKCILLYR